MIKIICYVMILISCVSFAMAMNPMRHKTKYLVRHLSHSKHFVHTSIGFSAEEKDRLPTFNRDLIKTYKLRLAEGGSNHDVLINALTYYQKSLLKGDAFDEIVATFKELAKQPNPAFAYRLVAEKEELVNFRWGPFSLLHHVLGNAMNTSNKSSESDLALTYLSQKFSILADVKKEDIWLTSQRAKNTWYESNNPFAKAIKNSTNVDCTKNALDNLESLNKLMLLVCKGCLRSQLINDDSFKAEIKTYYLPNYYKHDTKSINVTQNLKMLCNGRISYQDDHENINEHLNRMIGDFLVIEEERRKQIIRVLGKNNLEDAVDPNDFFWKDWDKMNAVDPSDSYNPKRYH